MEYCNYCIIKLPFVNTMDAVRCLSLITMTGLLRLSYATIIYDPGSPVRTYVGAVYEHTPISQLNSQDVLPRDAAMEYVKRNLEVYERQTRIAVNLGADIIVFPENGLYGYEHARESMQPYTEIIPDLNHSPHFNISSDTFINLCENPDVYRESETLRRLSCMAWENSIYLVANMAEKVACEGDADDFCPLDNRYQFNTNVVFDTSGNLIAKYRKYYLYWQWMYDRPREPEITIWYTPFGKFGTLTAGDIFYKSPALDLVRNHGVTSLAVPMTWDNNFLYPSAIQVQQGFAMSLGVNVLAANTQGVQYKTGGSGIYNGFGAIRYHYDGVVNGGFLTVAEVTTQPEKQRLLSRDVVGHDPVEDLGVFTVRLEGNVFRAVELRSSRSALRVCQGEFCCNLRYDYKTKAAGEFHVFGVFSGPHRYYIDLSIQVCGLITCSGVARMDCLNATTGSKSVFQKMTMWANFGPRTYTFPYVSTSLGTGAVGLAEKQFNFSNNILHASNGFSEPILSVILFGRNFQDDPEIESKTVDRRPTTVMTITKGSTPTVLIKLPTQRPKDHTGSGGSTNVSQTVSMIILLIFSVHKSIFRS